MQGRIVVGDTLDFLTEVVDYPPSAGWTLKHVLVPRFTTPVQAPITLTAITEDDQYRTQVGPATTATWTAGNYSWASWVEQAGARQEVESGQVVLAPDPTALAQGYDGRSQAQKAVDDLKAALATYTGSQGHVSEYSINGRMMRFKSSSDILATLSMWKAELLREKAAEAKAKGLADPRRFYLRARHG